MFRAGANEGGTLRSLAVRGAGITVLSGGLVQAIQIIATVVLARLLTPADFGLVAMVTTFSILFSNFGFNGFTEAVLQREEIDHLLISNLFWINLGTGLLLTIGFAAAGPLVALFYQQPARDARRRRHVLHDFHYLCLSSAPRPPQAGHALLRSLSQ